MDFISLLNLKDNRHVTILHESSTDAGFLLPYLVHAGVFELKMPTVVVSTQQLLLHYVQIARKLGGPISLSQLPQENFMFIDAISQFYEPPRELAAKTSSNTRFLHADGNELSTLLSMLNDHLQNLPGSLVLLDDLLPFVYNHNTPSTLISFLHSLLTIVNQV
jgi:hypothetical protein